MAAFKVVMTDDRHVEYETERKILEQVDAELVICNCFTEDEVIEACKDADGILLNMAPMTRRVVESLEKCKVISRYGIGYDNVDVDACTERGIWVANVPGYCSDDVAEHAIALMFSCIRQTALRDRLIRQGQWNIQSDASFRLAGKTLGVVGGGSIARALMKKVQGFGLKILVYSPHVPQEVFDQYGAVKASLEDLLRCSDIISLHVPANAVNRGMINRNSLAMMKKSAILINTGRGPLVDDEALVEALRNGEIAFAGLDTHNQEPLAADSPFLALDNVVLTDHCGYNTPEAVLELKTRTADNARAVLAGGAPNNPVNRL